MLVSMLNCVTKTLYKFQNPITRRTQCALYQWTRPKYRAENQLATPLDTSPSIPEKQRISIQKIVGTFLYYVRDVDCTMILAPNTITEQQSKPTQNTAAAIT